MISFGLFVASFAETPGLLHNSICWADTLLFSAQQIHPNFPGNFYNFCVPRSTPSSEDISGEIYCLSGGELFFVCLVKVNRVK